MSEAWLTGLTSLSRNWSRAAYSGSRYPSAYRFWTRTMDLLIWSYMFESSFGLTSATGAFGPAFGFWLAQTVTATSPGAAGPEIVNTAFGPAVFPVIG